MEPNTITDPAHLIHALLSEMPRPHDLPDNRCERCCMYLANYHLVRDRRGQTPPFDMTFERVCASCLSPKEKRSIDIGRAMAMEAVNV